MKILVYGILFRLETIDVMIILSPLVSLWLNMFVSLSLNLELKTSKNNKNVREIQFEVERFQIYGFQLIRNFEKRERLVRRNPGE